MWKHVVMATRKRREREGERVGGCPHISSDNLYFLQLCVIAILTPNPGQDGGWGWGGADGQQRGVWKMKCMQFYCCIWHKCVNNKVHNGDAYTNSILINVLSVSPDPR